MQNSGSTGENYYALGIEPDGGDTFFGIGQVKGSSGYTYLQSETKGSSYTGRPLALQALGGNVVVGAYDPNQTANFEVDGTSTFTKPIGMPRYTVSTLPSRVEGQRAYVTDATSCSFLGSLTGGGNTFCPVVYNGSAWGRGKRFAAAISSAPPSTESACTEYRLSGVTGEASAARVAASVAQGHLRRQILHLPTAGPLP